MSNLKTKKDLEVLRQYAISTAVDSNVINEGTLQLDNAVSDAKKMDTYLDEELALKKRLMFLLTQSKSSGMTPEIKDEIFQIKQKIQCLSAPQIHQYKKVQTQEIVRSYDELTQSNLAFAENYNINLRNPFMESFSNMDRSIITTELAEKFDLLRLDKYDYAFAASVGFIGGMVDAFLVGTAGTKTEDVGKLAQLTDKGFENLVMKYAKSTDWKGPNNDSDPIKSAIGHLERNFKVNYDQKNSKDIGFDFKLSPGNHHLRSISHSPYGLVFAILDLIQGKTTFITPEGKIVRYSAEKIEGIDGVVAATKQWFGHVMSDIAGASGSKTRGSGLPTGFETVLQSFNFGKIPISERTRKTVIDTVQKTQYGTVSDVVTKMFENGFDFRFQVATAIPVIVCEVLVRLYWFLKQHFYYGKSIKESMPFGKSRELQRLLLITSLTFETVDISNAIAKGVKAQNPISMFNSLNYIQLANFGYKVFVNFRLEHEHDRKIKDLMETEIKAKHEELMNANYMLE